VTDVRWDRYPSIGNVARAKVWLAIQANLGLAPNTIDAYARALEDYLRFSCRREVAPDSASREHVAAYVRDLTSRPNPRGHNVRVLDSGVGLANATLQQRLTTVRLYHDFLIEEGLRADNPVGRARRVRPGRWLSSARSSSYCSIFQAWRQMPRAFRRSTRRRAC
jgi:integrase/recombinase XerD